MKAILKNFHSPDIRDLANYVPEDPASFSFLLQISVGPENEKGADTFDIEVCTPKWLCKSFDQNDVIIGRHYLIVFHYNFKQILETIKSLVEVCEGETWREVAEKVGRIGKWEFEDYVPHTRR